MEIEGSPSAYNLNNAIHLALNEEVRAILADLERRHSRVHIDIDLASSGLVSITCDILCFEHEAVEIATRLEKAGWRIADSFEQKQFIALDIVPVKAVWVYR